MRLILVTDFILTHQGTMYAMPFVDFWNLTADENMAAMTYSLIEDERIIMALTGALESEIWT